MTGLGRLHAPDERDKDHLLPRKAAAAVGVVRRSWYSPPAYDQGNTSMCVAYSGVRYLTSGPVTNKALPFKTVYAECQAIDEWKDEVPHDGTSVRALFKTLKKRGLIDKYEWAFNTTPVIEHLLGVGPVVMGTDWYEDMFTPDRWGFVQLEGGFAGGHAYTLVGADKEKRHPLTGEVGAVRAVNSWGRNWGENGRFWLSFTDLDKLIRASGEAGVAQELKLAA